MREATNHIGCILDASYEKADLQDTVTMHCQHLSESQQKPLLLLFLKFQELFGKTLGGILNL